MNEHQEMRNVLEEFGSQVDVVQLSRVVTALIKAKRSLFQALDDKRFRGGLEHLAEKARDNKDPKVRLIAISALERLRVVMRSKAQYVTKLLRSALDAPLDSSQCLEDGDDRYYVASALQLSEAEWVTDYCAREIVGELSAENARIAHAERLLELVPAIEDGFDRLTSNWNAFVQPADDVPNAICRRLRRIFQALERCLGRVEMKERGLLGESSRRFITRALEGQKEPDNLAVLRALANTIALFLNTAIRARLSLLLDSSIYVPLRVCRRWFPLSSWPIFVGRSRDFGRLVSTLSQAILLSARQGVFEKGLLDALELCAGDRESAMKVTKSLAEANSGLSAAMQSWLKTWRTTEVESEVRDQPAFELDRHIAAALLEAWSIRHDGEEARRPEVEVGRALVSSIRALAEARGISLLGEVGSETDFAPDLHAIVGDLTGTRRVRILRPGVERRSDTGIRHVLVKAMCESVLAPKK